MPVAEHQLNAHLQFLQLLLDLFLADSFGLLAPRQDSKLQESSAAVADTRRIIDNILLKDWLASSGDSFPIQHPAHVGPLINEIVQRFDSWSRHTNVRLQLDLGDVHGCWARIESFHLGIVLTNLMKNAFQVTQSGVVFVTAARKGNLIRIEVRDQGPGIPSD